MKSLKSVLARVNQLAQDISGGFPGADIARILTASRQRIVERHRAESERGYPETAAERYARHVESKPRFSLEDAHRSLFGRFLTRQFHVWHRLEPEYAAEAKREKRGYRVGEDPGWWSQPKADIVVSQSAAATADHGDAHVGRLVAFRLIAIREARTRLLDARPPFLADGSKSKGRK